MGQAKRSCKYFQACGSDLNCRRYTGLRKKTANGLTVQASLTPTKSELCVKLCLINNLFFLCVGFLFGALYIISIFLWGVRNEKNYPLYIITFLFMFFTYIFYFVFDNYIFRLALLSK